MPSENSVAVKYSRTCKLSQNKEIQNKICDEKRFKGKEILGLTPKDA